MGQHDDRVLWPTILLFVGLVLALSAPLDVLLIGAGRLDIGRGFPIHLLMWTPAVAALITCRAARIDLEFLGLSRLAAKSTLLGYLIVVGYAVPTFAFLWITGLAALDWRGFCTSAAQLYHPVGNAPLLAIGFTLTFGVVQSLASAMGEEIGWRGFLVPALRSRLGLGATFVTSGLIWALWHFPLVIFADYGSETPLLFQLLCFTVMIIATGTIYGLIRLRSGSVWPAALMHALHNALIQWLLDPMTDERQPGAWYGGEFGAGLAVAATLVAAIMLARARGRSQKLGSP